jgi:hypothetical protein
MSFQETILAQMYFAGPLAVGFGLGLVALGHWLYPDANVSGRRSFIAGLVSPIAILASSWISRGFQGSTEMMVASLLTGVVLALVMFFAWLSPTPEERCEARFESDRLDPGPEAT